MGFQASGRYWAQPDEAVAVAHLGGHMGDLVATSLALSNASPNQAESLQEESAHIVRLQAPRACLLHPQPQFLHVGFGQHLLVQGALLNQPVEPGADLRVDHLVQARPHLGLVAVPDRLDE